ncbi:response regulator [Zhihengliuella halotolerans]|uniref:response regulator n=1 Tax=Zhihengliuella halotolerans TaxID=370736 RepID=UPI000C80FA01|nr:response regulator transcription factor [Zhihengliuella halotolerans]
MAEVNAPVRVLLADDENLVRAGLRLILDRTDGLRIVGEASDGAEAIDQAHRLAPDVVLMDIRMPGIDGIEATRRLAAAASPPRVLMLTAFETDEFILDALEAGACGFLLKDTPPRDLVAAVEQAAAGQTAVSPVVLDRLVAVATRHGRRITGESVLAGLSDREREVAEGVAQGLSNTEIARALFLSLPTVKTHLARIFAKLGVDSRLQLAIRVIESR